MDGLRDKRREAIWSLRIVEEETEEEEEEEEKEEEEEELESYWKSPEIEVRPKHLNYSSKSLLVEAA